MVSRPLNRTAYSFPPLFLIFSSVFKSSLVASRAQTAAIATFLSNLSSRLRIVSSSSSYRHRLSSCLLTSGRSHSRDPELVVSRSRSYRRRRLLIAFAIPCHHRHLVIITIVANTTFTAAIVPAFSPTPTSTSPSTPSPCPHPASGKTSRANER